MNLVNGLYTVGTSPRVSRSSVVTAPNRYLGCHGFKYLQGLRFFPCPTLVTNEYFIFMKLRPSSKNIHTRKTPNNRAEQATFLFFCALYAPSATTSCTFFQYEYKLCSWLCFSFSILRRMFVSDVLPQVST